MRTAVQLRGLIANQRERIAWLGVMLEEFPTDCLPRNFHAQCVLARQMLRSFEDELLALRLSQNLPAAPAQQTSDSEGRLVTSGEAQPAPFSHV